MSEKGTLSEDSASYAMLIAFPFEGEPFAAGFEAGMLWQGMWSGKEVIQMMVNAKLKKSIAVLARTRSYHVKFKKDPDPELISVTLRKNVATRKKRPGRRASALKRGWPAFVIAGGRMPFDAENPDSHNGYMGSSTKTVLQPAPFSSSAKLSDRSLPSRVSRAQSLRP